MIVKRGGNGPRQWPRRIVKRTTAPAVGERRREIVRRSGYGVQPPPEGRRLPSLAWRPSQAFAWTLSACLAVALLGAGAWWLLTSPFFQVNNIDVVGNERIAQDVLVQRAGLFGESMFRADLATAQERLYAQPLVASVRIERKWPSTVKLIVQERRAWGAWDQGGIRYTIDWDGVVLSASAPVANSPVIRSSDTTTLRQGDRVNYQAVQAAAEIY